MDRCILNQDGEMMWHRNMQARPEMLRKAIAPSRDDLVVAVACIFTWDWRADLWAREGMPCVLGHALSLQALHGGKAKNDHIAAQTMAVLWRGGLLPQADVSPAELRAPRDLWRRRLPLGRKRAERLAYVPNTHSPYHLPEIGKHIASKANRAGVAARFPAPAAHKSSAVDLALSDSDAQLLPALALPSGHTAKHQDATPFYRRRSLPGVGQLLALVMLDAMHDIRRFPRGQDCAASCRLGTGAKAAAGTRAGTSGPKLGPAYLPGALSEAAVLLLRHNDKGQTSLARLANT